MKKCHFLLLLLLPLLILITGCKDEQPAAQAVAEPAQAVEPVQEQQLEAQAPAEQKGWAGVVIETMNAGGYTYVQVETETEQVWAAAPQFPVSVGDRVMVPTGMAMKNHHSSSLERDFPLIYFVDSVLNATNPQRSPAAKTQMPEGHPPIGGMQTPVEIDLSGIDKADDGMSVAEVYAAAETQGDKPVKLRARVVKFTPQILGTNWIHIRDGSGDNDKGTNDLTVTAQSQVKVGDLVLVTGSLTRDKDFGHGYKYALIMEDADIVVE